jgi:hypothetical protein
MAGLNKKGLDKQGAALSTRSWITSFAPGSAELIGSVIKVHGGMHGKVVRDSDGSDEFDVSVDYLFAYPIEPPHQPDDWMRVVSEIAWTVGFSNWQGAPSSFAPWLTSNGVSAGVSGAKCGMTDGYSHPDYPDQQAQSSASSTGKPVDPYATGQANGQCETTTGT